MRGDGINPTRAALTFLPRNPRAHSALGRALRPLTMQTIMKKIKETAMAAKPVSYDCDVLVIGGGFSGSWAAIRAGHLGGKALVIDKGHKGLGGPWHGIGRRHDRNDARIPG